MQQFFITMNQSGTGPQKEKGKFSNANDATAEIIKRHAQRK
jgi:hypothetical protein